MKTMPAGKFKAQCLAVLGEVQSKRETVIVTKRGKPVAKLVPMEFVKNENPLEVFRFPGKIKIVGDILAPIHTDEEYEEFYRRSLEQLAVPQPVE